MSPRTRARRVALLLLLALPLGAAAQEEEAPPALSDSEVTDAFARMDSNRDGQLSLEEFENGIARPYGAQRDGVVYQKLPARFRVLDANADGVLDGDEYANLALRWQGAGAAPPPMAQADTNHDGRIDFREFARVHAPRENDPDAQAAPSAEEATPAAPGDSSTVPASTPRRSPGMRSYFGAGTRRLG